MDTQEARQKIKDHPELIPQSFAVCEGAVQSYISYLTETPVDVLFKGDIKDLTTEFKSSDGTIHRLGLALVDREYVFPLERCKSKAVVDAMNFIARATSVVYALVVDTIDMNQVRKPGYIMNSRMIVSPTTTMFLYSNDMSTAREIRDKPKHLGFVWL